MTHNAVQPLRVEKVSLSVQAQNYLRSLIEDGTYQPGAQLPSENQLASQLGISRPTLREALLNLEQEGIVVRRHGVGTFVAPGYRHQLESGLERLESILELAARQDLQVKIDELEVREELADAELAGKLQIPSGTPVTLVCRVIVVDRDPAAYMCDVVPSSILSASDIDEAFSGSVLDLLRQNPALQVVQAVAGIIAVNASSFLAKKLQVPPEQALLLLEEALYDEDGVVVEYSRNYFISDCIRFHVVRRSSPNHSQG
jgi:GntR family transcriptional regulator